MIYQGMIIKFKYFLTLISLLVLVSCGGGGSGSDTTYLVSTQPGIGGSITPPTQNVTSGQTVTFTVTPSSGYSTNTVLGCNGTLSGNLFTTGQIESNCTVTATFSNQSFIINTSTTEGGSISPTSQNVSYGAVANFNITANPGYSISQVTGCGGALSGSTYTTDQITSACQISATFQIKPISVTAYFPNNGQYWTSYVQGDSYSNATDTLCTAQGAGQTPGAASACIEAGEIRLVDFPASSNCTGLSADDNLHAFGWVCDSSLGHARFISVGLQNGTHLSDLIDFHSLSWLPNSVTIQKDGVTLASTPSTVWWKNQIISAGDGSSALSNPNTIYLITSNTQLHNTSGYNITGNNIGLVAAPGITAQSTNVSSTSSMINANDANFIWLEGELDASSAANGVSLITSNYMHIDNLKVSNASTDGVYIQGGSHIILSDDFVTNNGSDGIHLYSNAYNDTIRDMTSSNNASYGVEINTSSDNAIVDTTEINNGISGIYLSDNSDNNILVANTVANNAQYGVDFGSSNNTLIEDLFSTNNLITDIGSSTSTYNNITISDLTATNSTDGLITGCGSTINLYGVFQFGNNSTANYDCLPNTVQIVTSLTGVSIVGKTTADSVNQSGPAGTASYPATLSAFDWTHFDNNYRAWGQDGAAYPSSSNAGIWNSGTGRIWDFSLLASDTAVRDGFSLPDGSQTLTQTWFGGTTTTFLLHAYELVGNGDGLCESGEICLYTPNYGSYQGHGSIVTTANIGAGSVIQNVVLDEYQNNGY